jgi:hypothetical protein
MKNAEYAEATFRVASAIAAENRGKIASAFNAQSEGYTSMPITRGTTETTPGRGEEMKVFGNC